MSHAVQLRRVLRVVNGGTPTSDSENWHGEVRWATPLDLAPVHGAVLDSTTRTLTEIGLRTGSSLVPANSLVISTRAPIGYVAIVEHPTAFNQGCRGLVPRGEADLRYFTYQLVAHRSLLEAHGQGSTFAELTSDSLMALPIETPPLREQRAIADFLDAETARIDALIAKKGRMIELTRTRQEAEIRSRLRGDWPDLPLKRRWRVIDCKHRTPTYVDSGYPLVSPGDATAGRLDLTRCHRFVAEADYRDLAEPPRRPRRGDVVYSRNASIGIASYVETDTPFCMGQDVCLITSANEDQRFLMYALNTVGVDQLDLQKIGSTFSRVNVAQIVDLSIPCPPPEQQRRIADELDRRGKRYALLQSQLANQIELLREHRQALITAAVTGELAIP